MNAPPCKVLPNNELLPVTDNRSRDFRFRMILSSVAVSRSGASPELCATVMVTTIEIHRIEMTSLSQRTAPGVQSRRVPL